MKLSKKLNTRLICRGPIWDPGRSTIAKMLTVLVFIFLVLSLQHNIIFGQDVVNLVVLPPEIEDFPVLSVSFEITNLPNQPVPNIDIEQLTLFENDRQVPILSYEQVETGVHFALAINGGREFDIRDANGVSPYQTMSSEILGWASSRTFSPDDAWSFVTNEGIAIHNTNSNRSWITAVDTYQPDFRKLVPRTDALEKSIQMLKDWTVPFGVDKALLYITVPPSPDQITSIRTLTQEALTAGIHVSVWMIGDGYYLTNDQGGALIDLASLSGGQFFHFTGTETIPDPELNISYLGNYFSLTYQSHVRQTGTYPLSLTIDLPDGPVAGESTPFYIEVSPPKPVLLSPPTTITRQALSNVPDPMARLEPQIIALEFIVEFPDGRPREIEESRLFIDGDLSNVNTTPPLNRMDWDLSSRTESGQHTIQIEVKDTLGLSSRTIELPVVVELMSTSPSAADILPRQQTGLLISGAIFLAALIILFVWGFRQIIRSPRVLSVRQNLINRFKK